MTRIGRILSLLAGTSIAVIAQAQEADSAADAPAATSGIEDIIVTARRTDEAAQTIPIAITAFGAQQLADANVEGIADIARQTPNFFVQTSSADPTGVLLTIRGQSQQDSILTIESPIGVYVDGANYIRSSNLETALADVERVEVLRGPQGTLFGKNTTGGAINITTRQPDLSAAGGYVQASGATHDRYDLMGVANLPLVADTLGVRLLARWSDNGALGVNGLGNGIGGREQIAFRSNWLFTPGDSVTWAVSADYTRTRGDGVVSKLAFVSPFPSPAPGTPNPAPALIDIAISQGILDPALLADPVTNGAAIGAALGQAQALFAGLVDRRGFHDNDATGLQGVYARTYGVSSNLAVELTPSLSFRSISAARWLKRSLDVDLDASPFPLLEASLASRARNLSQEFQFAGDFGDRLDWIVGAYFNEETGRDFSRATALGTINPANPNLTEGFVKNSSWAVFGQFNLDLTDTLRFTGGLRWTEESKELHSFNRSAGGAICNIPPPLQLGGTCQARFKDNFSDYSYLASIDWTPRPGLLFYARTARSFKGGGQNLRGTGTADSFAAFAPETVTDYEAGAKLDLLDRRLRINAALFQANYRDIQRTIVQASTSGSIISLVTNAARARIRGGELEVTAVPVDGLTLSGGLGVNDAEYLDFTDVTGDRSGEPFQFPKYSYRLGATYKAALDFGELRLSIDWNWRSKVQLVGSAIYRDSLRQPGYGLLGARAAVTIDGIGSEIAVFATNLTGKRYYVSGVQFDNSLGFNSLYSGEPRVIGLQLTTRFGGER
ncbi:MAG TPA: TonB-dependent receptor [Sphingopyxis sp.]|nr:TonB-dependent receptor [Sphingopyxis sp.]HMP44112.1 TonB-dependent receptor [Sphingopyxis sp.]HMQ19727.1 TonB-dependent receptor [Sphingopyxis sp.]